MNIFRILYILLLAWLITASPPYINKDFIPTFAEERTSENPYWTCSMHPSVKMDKPGKCPICGMDLTKIEPSKTVEKKITHWTCSMHPSVKMDKPGKCPICSMDLIPVYEKEEGAVVEISEEMQASIGLKTEKVAYRYLTKEIYTVGVMDYDERRKSLVSARVGGRIDKLFIDFTGTDVTKGESLVWLYSPELVSAQQEYLLALENKEKVKDSPLEEARHRADSLLKAVRDRLQLWGITDKQIEQLEGSKKVRTHMVIFSPISGIVIQKDAVEGKYLTTGDVIYTIADISNLWMKANIYEEEIRWVRVGEKVEIVTPTYPDEVFNGIISFIEPFLDEKTRTIKIRCDIPNFRLKLKPMMYVNATIKVPIAEMESERGGYVSGLLWSCPEHPEIVSSRPGICPEDGLELELITGKKRGLKDGDVAKKGVCECPIDPEKLAGATCPDCGMELERKTIPEVEDGKDLIKDMYICPMGCYVSDEAGMCKNCSRQLKRWTVAKREGSGLSLKIKKQIKHICTMHPDEVFEAAGECPKCGMELERHALVLSIPVSAVIDTGVRKIAYVDEGGGRYVGREIKVGTRAGDYFPLLAGLKEGDYIVSSASFLIDSQSQLTGGASALYGGAMEFKEEEEKEQ